MVITGRPKNKKGRCEAKWPGRQMTQAQFHKTSMQINKKPLLKNFRKDAEREEV